MNVLKCQNVCKSYKNFSMENVSFELPMGYVMGFIGENGAGKSTMIKMMLDLVRPSSGKIEVFEKDSIKNSKEIKEEIGVVLDTVGFPSVFNTKDINNMMKKAYKNWNESTYWNYIKQFQLPEKKKYKEFSMGMKKKLAIAAALSHNPKLLILDEVTAGLDPIVRDEILDIFREFVSDGQHSIFISSHIISDLEKICDYVTFLHKGKLIFSMEKESLFDTYCMIRCSEEYAEAIPKSAICGIHKSGYGAEVLVKRKDVPFGFDFESANIEEIMLFLTKHNIGEKI